MTAATVIELDQEGPAAILRIEGDITSASEPDLTAATASRSRTVRRRSSSTSASSST